MAGKFNFTTKLGLDSKGFKAGVNQVRGLLGSLKSSFLSLASSLGAGLGFYQLTASLKDTATQLSVAKNTLKNVSYQTKAFKDGLEDVTIEVNKYEENLAFARRLSNDYAQDLVAVVDNYAKFTAASKKTSLSLENQRFVFEALTKAAAYYHLSADRTADMMNAVTQMMSKGKVAAEELRRQLGNTLPGAFNIMAASLGVSNAKLDEMMRNGEVIAADVLPKFAAMLNSVTKTAEFDSLQASMNNLKNAWYELVENSGVENLFKKVIDGSEKAVSFVASNINGIKSAFLGLFTYIGTVKIWDKLSNGVKDWKANIESSIKLVEKELTNTESKISGISGVTKGAKGSVTTTSTAGITQDDINLMKQYNALLLKQGQLHFQTAPKTRKDWVALRKEIKAAQKELTKLSASLTGLNAFQRGVLGIRTAFISAGKAMKAFFASNWVFLLISALTSAVQYIIKLRNETKEIKAISDKYAESINEVKNAHSEDAVALKNHLKTVQNTAAAESSRLLALKEINKLMGLTGDEAYTLDTLDKITGKYKGIVEHVEAWIEATKRQALAQALVSQITEAETKRKNAEDRIQDIATNEDKNGNASLDGTYNRFGGVKREVKNLRLEVAEYTEVITDAEQQLAELGLSLGDFFEVLDDGKESTLEELMGEFKKDAEALDNQLKEGAITIKDYKKEMDKLIQDTFKKAAGVGEIKLSDITAKLNSGGTLTDLEKWYYDLAKKAADAAQRALLDQLSKEFVKSIDNEVEEAIKAAEKLIEDQLDKDAEKKKKQLDLNVAVAGGDYETKKREDRDTLFDYKKTGSEKTSDELEQTNQWLDDITDKYQKLIDESNELGYRTEIVQKELDELSQLYHYAAQEAETLEAAMNYQKVVEDIKEVKKEINGLVYSGVKDFATSMDRVNSAWESLQETMKDNDATGWDKFMAIFNTITQVIDSAMGIYDTITSIQELQNKLGMAKIAEQTALNKLLQEELALRMAANGASDEEIKERIAGIGALFTEKGILAGILGLKKQENQQSAQGVIMKGAEAAASATAASASAGEAVAGATASGAKKPFPYNLIAIAAGVAAVVGALASMQKFASGGIVKGSSTSGDHTLARVNSGELILNKGQQGTLYKAIASGNLGGGGGEWRVRGTDLIKVIDNTNKKIGK